MTVYFHRDAVELLGKSLTRTWVHHPLEHRDPPKALGRILQGVGHILQDGLLPDSFLDLPLGLNIERIRVQAGDFPLLCQFGLVLSFFRQP